MGNIGTPTVSLGRGPEAPGGLVAAPCNLNPVHRGCRSWRTLTRDSCPLLEPLPLDDYLLPGEAIRFRSHHPVPTADKSKKS